MSFAEDLTGVTLNGGGVQVSKDIAGTFSDIGVITATGKMYLESLWKEETSKAIVDAHLGPYVYANRAKMGWVDVLAFSLVSKTRQPNPYNGRAGYLAGKRWFDELSLIMIAQEIVDSNGGKTWNSIMIQKNDSEPLIDDSTQVDSPFNPDSIYFDPKKAVFTYDPDNGYILYKNGEIVWTKTAGVYYDAANGQVESYDKSAGIVRFESGVTLNLVTLERTEPNGSKTTVSNKLPWYQQFFRKLMTDTKTQLLVLGTLVIMIVLKKRRNEK